MARLYRSISANRRFIHQQKSGKAGISFVSPGKGRMIKMRIQLSDHFTYKRLLQFVVPSILMIICSSVYSIVDGFFVSNFVGKTAFAAVNLIIPVLMFVGTIGTMIGTGGSAIVSKTMGEGTGQSIFFHVDHCGFSLWYYCFCYRLCFCKSYCCVSELFCGGRKNVAQLENQHSCRYCKYILYYKVEAV